MLLSIFSLLKVYMTDFFFICPIKSPQCTDKFEKKNIFDSDFSCPCFDGPKTWNFTSGGVQNRETENRRLRMIVTSFQDIKFRLKQISHCFPYMCSSNCVLKWYKSALFMGVVIRKTRKEVFLSIRYYFSVIKGLKPRKEGESGFPSWMSSGRTGQHPDIRWSVLFTSRQQTSAVCLMVRNISCDWKEMKFVSFLYLACKV